MSICIMIVALSSLKADETVEAKQYNFFAKKYSEIFVENN